MTKQTKDVQTVIDELATKGVEALDAMANFTQEQVDHIVHQAAIAALDKHMYLAKLAVDETGRGIYEDKAIKNMYASEYIWNSIKYDKTVKNKVLSMFYNQHIELNNIPEIIGVNMLEQVLIRTPLVYWQGLMYRFYKEGKSYSELIRIMSNIIEFKLVKEVKK